MIGFRIGGRSVRLEVPMPTDKDVARSPAGKHRTAASRTQALAQAERQRWRAVLLLTKAKLEACALGIETFETAFLAGIVTPSGQTVGQILARQLDAIASGTVPRLLPPAGGS